MTDVIAGRTPKLGQTTLRSIGGTVHHQRLSDNSTYAMAPDQMLGQMLKDNQTLTGFLGTPLKSVSAARTLRQPLSWSSDLTRPKDVAGSYGRSLQSTKKSSTIAADR
ncbi:hypothetical protein BH10ACI4_BH10ACI4_07710 [soil metagenome]